MSCEMPPSLGLLGAAPTKAARVLCDRVRHEGLIRNRRSSDEDQRPAIHRLPALTTALLHSHNVKGRRKRLEVVELEGPRPVQVRHPDESTHQQQEDRESQREASPCHPSADATVLRDEDVSAET
jgi:hypothetical protein